jgi:hypothetical protein
VFGRHSEKKAAEDQARALAVWQEERQAAADLVETARTFAGIPTEEITLAAGEALFLAVGSSALVEERRGPGHYQGGSTGFSVPLGHTGVRYRVGATRGHYVQGAPTPTAVDRGTAYVTNRRVVFLGASKTRECPFAKLLGLHHDQAEGETTFSISGRQTPVTLLYGPAVAPVFAFRLDLALAHFRGEVPDLVARLEADLARVEAARPPSAPG